MALQEQIAQKLAEDLSKPRPLTPQVLDYIVDHYGHTADTMPEFFADQVPTLEPYEIDLTFSPLFTPTLEDRAAYAVILGPENLSEEQVRALEAQLANETVLGHFLTPQGLKIPLALHEVSIERFVDRLYLDRPIEPSVYESTNSFAPEAFKPIVQVLVRKPHWQAPWRQEMLKGFLQTFYQRGNFSYDKLEYLTDFLKTYRPTSLSDQETKLRSVIDSCKKDLEALPGRSFHDSHLKEMYEDQETQGKAAQEEAGRVIAQYNHMIAMAEALLEDYETMMRQFPEAIQRVQDLQPA